MERIKLMTDSACDIPKELEEKYDIRILPFPVTVGDKGYMEREDFTNEEFYQILLDAPKIPITSQITAYRFEEEFTAVYDAGYTDLIYVAINGGGSGTYNNACMARDNFFDEHPEAAETFRIHVVDSHTYTLAYGYAVMEAARKARKGIRVKEILDYLDDWFASVEIYFAPYTLEFVKKSGRIPAAAAFVGEVMGLRPIISIIDGETKVLEKVRGDRAILPALLKKAKERSIPQTPYITLTGLLPEEREKFDVMLKKELGHEKAGAYQIGAAISINAGPKVVAIIVKGERRERK